MNRMKLSRKVERGRKVECVIISNVNIEGLCYECATVFDKSLFAPGSVFWIEEVILREKERYGLVILKNLNCIATYFYLVKSILCFLICSLNLYIFLYQLIFKFKIHKRNLSKKNTGIFWAR